MFKKMWVVFMRDLKVSKRDFISLLLLVFPFLIAIAINLFTPSINDTTVNLALLEGENPGQIAYFKDFAKVELFKDIEGIKERVVQRDDIIGIIPEGEGYYIMTQGDESKGVVDYAKLLNTYYELDVQIEDTNGEIIEFGRTAPPLKKILVNIGMLLTSIFGGMLIAINIIEEKMDKTIRAVNITPISQNAFIFGKGIMGLLLPLYGSVVILLITGFGGVNIAQILIMILSLTLLSLLVGFIQGINNDDIIGAAGSIKLLMLPLAASIAAIELLSDKWQKFFYWSPFYWAYKGNDGVLSHSASWQQVIMYTVIILALCSAVYIFLAPKIRKGLE